MADVEFESKLRISREQAGERLITLGKSLTGGARTKLEHEGDSIHFTVADALDWEFELNIDGDEVELEIELKWSSREPAAPAGAAAPSTPASVNTPTPAKARAASKRAKSRQASG